MLQKVAAAAQSFDVLRQMRTEMQTSRLLRNKFRLTAPPCRRGGRQFNQPEQMGFDDVAPLF